MRFRRIRSSFTEDASILIFSPDRSLFRILNASKGSVLVRKAVLATGFFTRFKGLSFNRDVQPDAGMIFPLCSSIHTFGMRFPIDVVFIDDSFRVLRVFEKLPPQRFSHPVRGSFCAIELLGGAARQSRTEIEDELAFEPFYEEIF